MRNTVVGGTQLGPVIQTDAVHGGIHLHAPPAPPPVPRELMPVPASFTDRTADIESLTAQVGGLPDQAVRVVAITGPGGIGKSVLATRFLHLLADEYSCGQLYADLRGHTPASAAPADPHEVLSRFLRVLLPQARPGSADEVGALWRSATAARGHRISILLDNAHNTEQIRGLLPGGSGHLVVVTSRNSLPGLAAFGAVRHRLKPFDTTAARQFLTHGLGTQRVDRDPDGTARLIDSAAGSPMALALAITRLADNPGLSLTPGAAPALDPPSLPSVPPGGVRQESAVTHALDHAYRSLPADSPARLVHRRMAASFALDIDPHMTAAVCNLTVAEAGTALGELHARRLIEPVTDNSARGPVYRHHDLARRHALALTEPPASGENTDVLRRGLDFLLATATAAERTLTPYHRRLNRTYRHQPAEPLVFPDDPAALAWLTAHSHHLLPAMRAATAHQLHESAWQLAHAFWPLLRATHDIVLWAESHRIGIDAARHCGDRIAEIELLMTWGVGLRAAHRFDEATATFRTVAGLAREAADRRAESQSLHERGATALHDDRPAEAEKLLLLAHAQRTALAESSTTDNDRDHFLRGTALTEICLGQARTALGRHTEAVSDLTRARAALLTLHDPLDAARALVLLARAHASIGDLDTAQVYGRQAVDECDAADSVRWSAHSRELLGHTALGLHDPERARTLYRQAHALYKTASNRDAERVDRHLQRLS
ncbi:hypothetical protein [Streptomyces acidiscabies]|uniref:Regulatory protein AfsR n=1 Tax=Streptomyces acidiscabies TaxID=42234 RepID=A0ABU4MBM8_9ACTN|nr:hypothetical protein [Streptomyces acidiscabies]MDX3024957.1 hypothetical protein [Streptomyces acidiscabies]